MPDPKECASHGVPVTLMLSASDWGYSEGASVCLGDMGADGGSDWAGGCPDGFDFHRGLPPKGDTYSIFPPLPSPSNVVPIPLGGVRLASLRGGKEKKGKPG